MEAAAEAVTTQPPTSPKADELVEGLHKGMELYKHLTKDLRLTRDEVTTLLVFEHYVKVIVEGTKTLAKMTKEELQAALPK